MKRLNKSKKENKDDLEEIELTDRSTIHNHSHEDSPLNSNEKKIRF